MSTRFLARRLGQELTAVDSDVVLAGCSLPSGSIVHDIRARIQMIGVNVQQVAPSAHGFALEMYVIPIQDPDSNLDFDTFWDRFVVKDSDVATMDLDTVAQDTAPMWEPGEHALAKMFDVGVQPEKLWSEHTIVTMAGSHVLMRFQDFESPFGNVWLPGGMRDIHISRKLRMPDDVPCILVVGVGHPAFDDTTTVEEQNLVEAEWAQVKFVDHVMERMLMDVLGLTEAGSETPWEEATALIFKHVEPDVFEETADFFTQEPYNVVTEFTCDHSVDGTMPKALISSGR